MTVKLESEQVDAIVSLTAEEVREGTREAPLSQERNDNTL